MNGFQIAGGILSGINSTKNIKMGKTMREQGESLLKSRGDVPLYASSPYASQNLATVRNAYNGRMTGASQLERNIYGNQANYMGNVNRNATDGSQALALAAAGQGQTNDAFGNLAMTEAQNKNGLLGQLQNAYGTMIGEGDKVYNSQLNKYNSLSQEGYGLKGAGMQNVNNGWNGLAGTAFGMGQLLQGDINQVMGMMTGGMLGGKGGGGGQAGGQMGGGNGGGFNLGGYNAYRQRMGL